MQGSALEWYSWVKLGSTRRCSYVLQTHLLLNRVLKGSRDRMSVTIFGWSCEIMSVPPTFSSSFSALAFFLGRNGTLAIAVSKMGIKKKKTVVTLPNQHFIFCHSPARFFFVHHSSTYQYCMRFNLLGLSYIFLFFFLRIPFNMVLWHNYLFYEQSNINSSGLVGVDAPPPLLSHTNTHKE